MESEINKPYFAVCLAAYNGMAYIEAQIETILQQVNVDLQIFISIDKSVDGMESWLACFALNEPRVTLLPLGQSFGSAGRNFYRLLRDTNLNSFTYLSFADQDDLWHSDKLWSAHCLMAAQNALGYSSNVTAFWPTRETQLINKAQPQVAWDYLFEAAGPGCTYVLHSNLALALQKLVRDSGDRILKVDYHDWLIYAFARSHKYPWVIDDRPSMQYRQHANNQIGVNSGWRSYWVRARKMLNGHGFEQSLLISDFVEASSTLVVQRGLHGGRLGYLWLSLQAFQCRRKRLDQLWFFILCILFVLFLPANRGSE